jgi:hypothetical protein
LSTDGYTPDLEHSLSPDKGEPVRLAGDNNLYISTILRYCVVQAEGERGPWKVETTAYYHALETQDAKEIVSFQWHPAQASTFTFPHLHLEAGIGANLGILEKTHIPTGRIALEDVLRFAILELGVEPQREGWAEILGETQGRFEEWRTWHGSGPTPS